MGRRFVQLYDKAMWPLEKWKLHQVRKNIVSQAKGRVLEIGSGTGVNFPYYSPEVQVDAVEPDPMMRNKSLERLNKLNPHSITTHLAGAERLPFPDDTFDTVIGTLVFCTIPEPEKALEELYRVSKPGAALYLFEHVKVNHPMAARAQEKLTPIWKKICDGCHLDRETLKLVQQSEWQVTGMEPRGQGLFLSISCIKESNLL